VVPLGLLVAAMFYLRRHTLLRLASMLKNRFTAATPVQDVSEETSLMRLSETSDTVVIE
jgi:hypothetical protein